MRRFAALFLLLPGYALADLSYTVTPEPQNQSIRVKLELEAKSPTTEIRIPYWCPGYYVEMAYQKKMSDVKAVDSSGKALAIAKPDERGWKVTAAPGTRISFTYRVLGDDPGLGFFGVNVQPHTVFINGPSAFVYPAGRLEEKVRLRFNLPPDWDVATAMDHDDSAVWTSAGYDEFVDHPIQIGKFERRPFKVEGVPFEAVFVSQDQNYAPNMDEEARQLAQLSQPAIKMMEGAPFKRYIYFIHLAVGDFSGGLEHRASTVLAVPSMVRLRLNELATHEFYHAWNVKQIRPKVLGPFDYTQKVRTRNLWFAEGVTDYYAHLHAYQAGLRDARGLAHGLSEQISELQSSRNRKTNTLEEASLGAWEGGSMGVGDLSYYTKGSIAGLIFDAAIRDATDGEKSLDDVMRLMFERYRLPKPGYEEDAILKTINEVAGKDLTELYRRVVQSKEEVPYEELKKIGLRVATAEAPVKELGFRLEGDRVEEVDSEASGVGLRKGDQVTRVAGKAFGQGCFAMVSEIPQYQLEVYRDGKVMTFEMKTKVARHRGPVLELDPFADARAEKLREGWLRKY